MQSQKKKKKTFGYGKNVKDMQIQLKYTKKTKKDFLQICSLI